MIGVVVDGALHRRSYLPRRAASRPGYARTWTGRTAGAESDEREREDQRELHGGIEYHACVSAAAASRGTERRGVLLQGALPPAARFRDRSTPPGVPQQQKSPAAGSLPRSRAVKELDYVAAVRRAAHFRLRFVAGRVPRSNRQIRGRSSRDLAGAHVDGRGARVGVRGDAGLARSRLGEDLVRFDRDGARLRLSVGAHRVAPLQARGRAEHRVAAPRVRAALGARWESS